MAPSPADPSAAPPAAGPAAARLVEGYLATLTETSPSTQRQRTWALRELLTHPGASSPATLLAPQHVRSWLDAAATADPPASLPGLRARASAARALAQHAERTGTAAPGTTDALAPVLRMPAPPLAPGPAPDPVRRLLVAAHPDRRPLAVHPAVWTRFCAHVHLLALTGEREDVMARLQLGDVTSANPGTPDTPDTPGTPGTPEGPEGPGVCAATDPGTGAQAARIPSPETHNSQVASVTTNSHDETGVAGSHIDGDAVTPPLFADDLTPPDDLTGGAGAPGGEGDTEAAPAPPGADPGPGWERLREQVADASKADASRAGPPGGRRAPDTTGSSETWGWRVPGPAGAVAASHVVVRGGLNPRSWRLPEPARTAVSGWLADRAVLAALLQGSDPGALWLRVRPSTDLRTGALRPAGLPLSDRGLRLAFTTTLAVLALEDRELQDLSTSAVRAYARGRGPW